MRETVVETAELEPSFGEQVHRAGIVERDRDLRLVRCGAAAVLKPLERSRGSRCFTGASSTAMSSTAPSRARSWRRDVDFHAGAEDVLQRVALDRSALWDFFNEEDVPAFLA